MEENTKTEVLRPRAQKAMKNPANGLLSVGQAADYVGLAKGTMYKMVMRQDVASYRPNGGRVMLKPEDLDNWIEAQRRPSRAEIELKALTIKGGRK